MPELAYVNGTFEPIAEAKVSVEDRGLQFGDSVYEVLFAYGGRLFMLEPHMRRLRQSCAGIRLEYDFEAGPLEPVIAEGLRLCQFSNAMIYIQLTRGVAPRAHEIPENIAPTVIMTFKALPTVPDELRQRGARLMTTLDTRWANCYIKATTLLPNVLAKDEAKRRGYDDTIFITEAGEVRECTSSNIFIANGGRLQMPPRSKAILHGVTQDFLLERAAAIGLTVDERAFDVEALHAADEVFMSGTVVEALGVTSIDDRPVADGRVGPITKRMYEEFQGYIRRQG